MGLLSPTFTDSATVHVNNMLTLPYTGTNDRGIGVEPAFFDQTMRAFVTRLVNTYRETLAHICIIVR